MAKSAFWGVFGPSSVKRGRTHIQGGPKKTGPFLRVYNFATVGARNACDISKFSKFYLEKYIKLACQCI